MNEPPDHTAEFNAANLLSAAGTTEAKYSLNSLYESEVVYHNMEKELEEKGIIFKDTDSALRENEEHLFLLILFPYYDIQLLIHIEQKHLLNIFVQLLEYLEQKYLAGVSAQYESEVVYHNMEKELEEKGIIFKVF
jgi:Fe-S cluster assembly scaffold protein SufB